MNNIKQRILLFLIGCVGFRFLFVVIAKNIDINYLKYLGYLALIFAIGFMHIYMTGIRKTGPETFGDKIWWDNLRPIHSIFYFLFAYNAIIGNKQSWMFLLADVVIGLISFLIYHYVKGNFLLLERCVL